MKNAILTEKTTSKFDKLIKSMFRHAYAEESNNEPSGDAEDKGQAGSANNTSTGEGNTGTKEKSNSNEGQPDYTLMNDPKVAQLIQKARSDEKQKLHTELDGLKKQLEAKTSENTQLAIQLGEKSNEVERLKGEITDLENQATMSADDKVKAIKEQVTAKETEIARLTGELAQADIKFNTLQLDTYKQSKIAEAGGNIITELVTGATMSDIDESIEKAKALYAKYNPNASSAESTNTDSSTGEQQNNANPNTGGAEASNPMQSGSRMPSSNPARGSGEAHIEISSMNVMKNKGDLKKYQEMRDTLKID